MTWTGQAEAAADGITETGVLAASIVAAAWRGGVHPDAVAGLTAAAVAMYAEPKDLLTGPLAPLANDRDLIEQAADIATDTGDHAHAVRVLSDQVEHALDAAVRGASHAAARLAEDDASARRELRRAEAVIADCEHALKLLIDAGQRLDKAFDGLDTVPDDLLAVYELAYAHCRRGGTFTFDPEFITPVVVQ